jgi:hypothetical protein
MVGRSDSFPESMLKHNCKHVTVDSRVTFAALSLRLVHVTGGQDHLVLLLQKLVITNDYSLVPTTSMLHDTKSVGT